MSFPIDVPYAHFGDVDFDGQWSGTLGVIMNDWHTLHVRAEIRYNLESNAL